MSFFGFFDIPWYFCQRSNASGEKYKEKSFAISGGLVKEKFTSILESYVLGTKILGRGASAEVILGINNNTNREYAVKRIDIKKDGIAWRYEREKKIMKDIDHPNCIRLFEVYKNIDAHYFVMELCTGGHLGQALRSMPDGRFDVSMARRYITQIVSAISHCHKVGICHRDIKLQNILLENNNADAQIKVIDFGNAQKFIGCLPLTKVVGTTYTAAPEVFRECYGAYRFVSLFVFINDYSTFSYVF
jgi:serine/threonine protein kinase